MVKKFRLSGSAAPSATKPIVIARPFPISPSIHPTFCPSIFLRFTLFFLQRVHIKGDGFSPWGQEKQSWMWNSQWPRHYSTHEKNEPIQLDVSILSLIASHRFGYLFQLEINRLCAIVVMCRYYQLLAVFSLVVSSLCQPSSERQQLESNSLLDVDALVALLVNASYSGASNEDPEIDMSTVSQSSPTSPMQSV